MEHSWVMMLFVDELDLFCSYTHVDCFYTSACEVVEKDVPGLTINFLYHLQDVSIVRAAINETCASHQALISIAYRGPPPSWSCYRGVTMEKGRKWTECCVCSDRTPGDKVMAHHCCSTIVLSAGSSLASFPGPSREERAWYTLHVHALGSP